MPVNSNVFLEDVLLKLPHLGRDNEKIQDKFGTTLDALNQGSGLQFPLFDVRAFTIFLSWHPM